MLSEQDRKRARELSGMLCYHIGNDEWDEVTRYLGLLLDEVERLNERVKEQDAKIAEFIDGENGEEWAKCEGCQRYTRHEDFVKAEPPDIDVCKWCAQLDKRDAEVERLEGIVKHNRWLDAEKAFAND